MRRLWLPLIVFCLMAAASLSRAATGAVIKVLPQFLDSKGRHALSPSLYDRDAYQAVLRLHPEQRSTIRFAVQWKARGPAAGPLKLRVQVRGVTHGDLPDEIVLDEALPRGGWFSHWAILTLTKEQYKTIGDVTAWRATLWENDRMIGEQKSFLW
jgi:hypothetical protein